MIIIKTKQYTKDLKKYIINKHKTKELIRINNIENIILISRNLRELVNSTYKNIYHIEAKTGDLSGIYTARINSKIRLVMKPVGDYPYDKINIEEIEFLNIDETHYGEG